jgi:hypothetical protein
MDNRYRNNPAAGSARLCYEFGTRRRRMLPPPAHSFDEAVSFMFL